VGTGTRVASPDGTRVGIWQRSVQSTNSVHKDFAQQAVRGGSVIRAEDGAAFGASQRRRWAAKDYEHEIMTLTFWKNLEELQNDDKEIAVLKRK
jgi:hypothetical protein